MHTKVGIYNLALNALLLSRQISDVDADKSNECKILNTNWENAFGQTIADLNLDSTSTHTTLQLLSQNPVPGWAFVYRRPVNCALIRRIRSCEVRDNAYSKIPLRTGIWSGGPAIFTNQQDAILEFIPTDFPMSVLSPPAGLAIALHLAIQSVPLISGKGAKALIELLSQRYAMTKATAQELDRNENFVFESEFEVSEWVRERTT